MDFLAIGDTVVDTFIRLEEAEAHCDVNNEHCTLTMRFGDKIPYEFAVVLPAVGNSANAAVAAARLGLAAGFIGWVGNDRSGEDCRAALVKERVDTQYLTAERGKETNQHYVLWYGPERTILIKHEAYEYALPEPMPVPKTVYLSSLGEAALALHEPLADWLEKNPKILFAFQPGTFQMKAGLERLKRIYARSDIFIANKEEYQRILGTLEEDAQKLMNAMRTHGPKICFLTDGPGGAYAFSDAGAWSMPLYPDGRVAYERTGAGDAFSSAAVIALSLGKNVPEALAWGPINAASVVQQIGAQKGLLTREALEGFLAKAPADYRARPL